MRFPRLLLLKGIFLGALLGSGAVAETPSGGDGSQTGDGSTRFTGLAQAPEANLYVGSATMSIPFTVPPGRKNLTPQLGLSYNSHGGSSPYGYGWDLPIPRIQRSTMHGVVSCNADYNYGVPGVPVFDFDDTYWDEFVLTLPGGSTPCTRRDSRCEPHVEQSFLKILFDDANNEWTAWDKSGNRYEFGRDAATVSEAALPSSSDFDRPARTGSDTSDDLHVFPSTSTIPSLFPRPDECTYTFSWALTAIVDPNGNRMDFRYRLLEGVLYPHSIRYGADSEADHPFQVDFTWETRAGDDQMQYGTGGFEARLTKRLSLVTIRYRDLEDPVRSYGFAYLADFPNGDPAGTGKRGRQSFLESVTLRDGEGMPLERADGKAAAAVSAYEATLPGFASAAQIASKPQFRNNTMPNALRWTNNGHTERDVFDINGDGFADIVDAWPAANCAGNCKWDVYFGSQNGFSTTVTPWSLPLPAQMHTIRGADAKRATMDLTGDGIADYIIADAEGGYPYYFYWHVYPGTPSPSGWGFSPAYIEWLSPANVVNDSTFNVGFLGWSGGTAAFYDVVDMTGDGLVDLLDATGDDWRIWPNTGSGFGPAQHFAPAYLSISYTTAENGLVLGLFDINGDALPDQVWSGQAEEGDYSGAWQVCLNTGHAMAPCKPWTVPEFGLWRFIRKSIATQALDTVRDLFDINGDGLPDLVERINWQSDHSWHVYLNRGNGFEQQGILWSAPQFVRNGSPGGGGTMADTFDINGDGIVDNVVFNDSSTTYSIRHPLAGAWRRNATNTAVAEVNPDRVRTDLLVETERGTGASTVLHYRPSTQWNNTGGDAFTDLPFVSWTVTEIRHRDGLCPPAQTGPDGSCSDPAHEVATKIDYEGGRFDSVNREFRGFNRVYTKPIVPASVPHAATLTVFHQIPAALSGKVAQSTTYNATGTDQSHPISATINEWECADPGNGAVITCPASPHGDVWVRLKKTTDRTYQNFAIGTFKDTVSENLLWHQCEGAYYGNVDRAYRGSAAAGGPRLYTHTQYACQDEATAYLVDRPTHVVVKDSDDAEVLEEKWFWYDNETDLGEVTEGNTTKVQALLDINDVGPVGSCAETPSAPGGCVTTTMLVDGVGNVTEVTDARGGKTGTTYDAHGIYPLVVTQPVPAAGQARHSVKTVYDPACGSVLQATIPYTATEPSATERTRHEYDTFCRRIKSWIPGDAAGATRFKEYVYQVGAPQLPTVVTTYQREPSHAFGEFASSVLADGLGRPVQQKTESVIDGTWAISATLTEYDAVGRAWRTHAPFVASTGDGFETISSPAATEATTVEFDAAGRRVKVINPDASYRTVDHGVAWETTTRDECVFNAGCTGSRHVEKRDALGRSTERWLYDEGGALKQRTRWTFDEQNRVVLTEQGDASGGAGGWNVATGVAVDYDTLGRKVRVDDPDSGAWLYRYDHVGNLIFQDDPASDQHIELCYDGMNRPTKKFYVPANATVFSCALTADVTWTYTTALYGLGQAERITDRSGQTYFAEYNVRGQVARMQRLTEGVTAETTYLYDGVGKVLALVYPDGEAVVHGYDSVGRIKSLQNSSGAPVYLQSLTYDRFGRPRRITHGNGVIDERTYGAVAAGFRLERIRAYNGATNLFNYNYNSYTATGLVKQLNDDGWAAPQPSLMKATAGYTYDGIGRMTAASSGAAGVGIGSRGYTYNEWGNLTSKEGVFINYTDSMRPHRVTNFSGGAVGDVEHDDNGNRTLRDAFQTAEQHYTYDLDDRLTRVVVGLPIPGASAVDFAYDAGGARTREKRGTLLANDTIQATEIVRHYSGLYEVTANLTANPATYTARKYYVAGGLLIASRELPAPTYLRTVVASAGPAAGGVAYASAQPAPSEAGAVDLVTSWMQGPVAIVMLSPPAASVSGGCLLLLVAAGLLVPTRRRRAVVGIRVQPVGAVAMTLLVILGAAPWPLQVRPAAAQSGCDPTPTPTAVPLPQIHHYHLDHLGSPQTVSDGSATVVHQIRYDPYGKVRGRWRPNNTSLPTYSPQDRREFTGYQLDPISELSYAGARFYDPILASFLTHDPMREFANPYTYTNGDPVNLADPSGMCIWDGCILEAILIGAAAGFAANAIQAASKGASVGEVFKAAAIGAGIGAVGAGIGIAGGIGIQQGVAALISNAAVAQTTTEMIQAAMLVGGLGQSLYGLSQGDVTGIVGMSVSIGLGFALLGSAPSKGVAPGHKRSDPTAEGCTESCGPSKAGAFKKLYNVYKSVKQGKGDTATPLGEVQELLEGARQTVGGALAQPGRRFGVQIEYSIAGSAPDDSGSILNATEIYSATFPASPTDSLSPPGLRNAYYEVTAWSGSAPDITTVMQNMNLPVATEPSHLGIYRSIIILPGGGGI